MYNLRHKVKEVLERGVIQNPSLHLLPAESGQRAQTSVHGNVLRGQDPVERSAKLRRHVHELSSSLATTKQPRQRASKIHISKTDTRVWSQLILMKFTPRKYVYWDLFFDHLFIHAKKAFYPEKKKKNSDSTVLERE